MANNAGKPTGLPPVSPPWHPGIAGAISELEKRLTRSGAETSDEFMTALSDVVHEGGTDAVVNLFGGTAWGHIVWKRDVGAPLSAKLADAFVFTHLYKEPDSGQISQEGEGSIGYKWKPAPAPEVWDGPHDDECYRVSFMLRAQPPWKNGVGIDLDRTVQWEPRTAPWLDQRMRYVAYPPSLLQNFPGEFVPKRDSLTIFDDDFQVLWWPF